MYSGWICQFKVQDSLSGMWLGRLEILISRRQKQWDGSSSGATNLVSEVNLGLSVQLGGPLHQYGGHLLYCTSLDNAIVHLEWFWKLDFQEQGSMKPHQQHNHPHCQLQFHCHKSVENDRVSAHPLPRDWNLMLLSASEKQGLSIPLQREQSGLHHECQHNPQIQDPHYHIPLLYTQSGHVQNHLCLLHRCQTER